MNISLPTALRSYVDERVAASAYTSASEYVRELIRKDREDRTNRERLEQQLLEGLASGSAEPFDDDFFETLKERIRGDRAPRGESA